MDSNLLFMVYLVSGESTPHMYSKDVDTLIVFQKTFKYVYKSNKQENRYVCRQSSVLWLVKLFFPSCDKRQMAHCTAILECKRVTEIQRNISVYGNCTLIVVEKNMFTY